MFVFGQYDVGTVYQLFMNILICVLNFILLLYIVTHTIWHAGHNYKDGRDTILTMWGRQNATLHDEDIRILEFWPLILLMPTTWGRDGINITDAFIYDFAII